ncbi:MAG: DUF1816 domain-containing protein [Xenococcus sp. MO_188.B8]|nr:DUF1816 domain-containing protein [Xenococcus sp. MO_188.B8]
MNPRNISLQQSLQSTESSLQILRQNLSQLPAQPDELSATIKQLSLIQFKLQSVFKRFSLPSDKLISVLNHEFLTPLTLIQGSLQLLAAGKFDSLAEEVPYLLNVALRQTNKLIRIVRELLAYQQMKSGQLSIFPQQCRATELIKQASQVIELSKRHVQLILSIQPVCISVWADPHYIILLLSHLLSNAIKFSPTRSIVTLTATSIESGATPYPKHDLYIPETDFVLFQIKDRGIGIPPNQLEKIFDCFYQINSSDSRPYNGLGLGLALCYQIVKLHDGQLWAESTLGAGSTFYFTLPICPQARHWWVEIQTKNPQCIYYFGPFETVREAISLQDAYLEDLRQEQAQITTVVIKQCQPKNLTICLPDGVKEAEEVSTQIF